MLQQLMDYARHGDLGPAMVFVAGLVVGSGLTVFFGS